MPKVRYYKSNIFKTSYSSKKKNQESASSNNISNKNCSKNCSYRQYHSPHVLTFVFSRHRLVQGNQFLLHFIEHLLFSFKCLLYSLHFSSIFSIRSTFTSSISTLTLRASSTSYCLSSNSFQATFKQYLPKDFLLNQEF